MKVSCAECGCVVEQGVRVDPCEKRDCCCLHLPRRGEAGPDPGGPSAPTR